MKEIKRIAVQRALRRAGFTLDHIRGSHHIYRRGEGEMLTVPLARSVNGKLWQDICKQHNIPWDV